ncbi:MAG TPA: hypothetical protein VND98_09405 [Solirubrobacterales bacterium]|nr:hypothetical protein [Solirubrobacterales bacterium]
MGARAEAGSFTAPEAPNQRRYEALRAYFVEGASAQQVAERFGYARSTVETLVRDHRAGRLSLFASSRPGPRGAPRSGRARDLVLALRRAGRSLAEIERATKEAGRPLGRTAIWELCAEAGLGRLEEVDPQSGEPVALAPKARPLEAGEWPTEGALASEHAGLFLLVPELVELELDALVSAAGYPRTSQLPALHSVLSLLALKLYGRRRRSHVQDVVHDPALGLYCGLRALPKRSHLSGYSYRIERAQNEALLAALVPRQRAAGLLGEGRDFNLDFHAIMSYGSDEGLEEHYVPRRSQRTRSVLSFFAQDGSERTLCYANADLAKAEAAREVIRFCEFWQRSAGELPRLLVFDSKLTTHAELAELDRRGVGFITLRRRGGKLMERIAALPEEAWQPVRLDRPGKHRNVKAAESEVELSGRSFRQLAVSGLGREQPTLVLTNRRELSAKQLVERYAQRWLIENGLAHQIRAFHLDCLASQVPLAVDLDTTLSVLCDSVYRHFARTIQNGYATAAAETLFRHFITAPGELRFGPEGVKVMLRSRAHTPVLLDAGYEERRVAVPWWEGRELSFSFKPA